MHLDLTQPEMPSAEVMAAAKAVFEEERRRAERRVADVGRTPDRRSLTSRRSDELGLDSMSRAELVAATR